MIKIAKSLVMIAAVAALAVGATAAQWTSTATIQGMTFATGTLEISDVSSPWMQHVVFNNLKPGDTIRKWVVLKNTGTEDIASLKVSAVNLNDPDNLLGQITVAVYGQVEGYDQGIYTPDWSHGKPVNGWLVTGADILGTAVYRDATAGHVLKPGEKDTIILDFRVPSSLENEWQNKSASFDLQFDAEQGSGAFYF